MLLPVGAFAFSNGVEAAVQEGVVRDAATLREFVAAALDQAGVIGRLGGDVSQGLKFAGGASLLGMGPTAATAAGLAGSMLRPTLDTAKVVKLALQTEEGRKVLFKELAARKDKPLREIMQKVAVGLSATEPVQQTTRDAFGTTSQVVPFPNER